MEMLKKLKKRIVPLVLAVVIFATSVVSGPASLTAQAASVAVSPEMSVEFVMMLYNIFETISIASGIKDGLDDYDSGMSLFEAFISFIDSLAYDPFKEFTIYGPDGSVMTQEDMDALLASAVGAGNLKVRPDKKAFAKYRIIDGTVSPSQSPDPSSSPDPDDKYVNPFTDLQGMFVGANLVAAGADFLSSVQNNAVPDVDPAKYYDQGNFFTGYPTESNAGNSFYKLSFIANGSPINQEFSFITTDSRYYYFFEPHGADVDGRAYLYLYKYFFQTGQINRVGNVDCKRLDGTNFTFNWIYYSVGTENPVAMSDYIFESNIPVFNYFKGYCEGDTSQLLYAPDNLPYDYHSMTAAAPDTLENLSGTKLDPAKVPAMNNAMKEAANGVEATGTDKEANNAEMIAAVKAAVAEALAEAQPDPSSTTAPDPEPSVAPDPGTDTDYTGILGLILAAIKAIASSVWDFFSNPMGIITNGITSILELFPQVNTLIQALPAAVFGFFQDPLGTITSGLTNLYNGVLRIIEIFPEQVQLVLGNIASLPSAMLQMFADPLGAIQSLLGLLPSWANLQAYLDKILQALLDPVSVVLPSDPGGTDSGGDGSDGGGSRFNLSSLFNGLIYLILILILLLKIFIHCLQFIINIFKIEPTQGFLPDDMVTGLNFLKQLQIEGIGLSVYDFMMGLVYILMFFGVVKLLRGYVYKIRIPSGGK